MKAIKRCWLQKSKLQRNFSGIDLGKIDFSIGKSEKEKFTGKHYDIAIIGGGSGGLSCAYVFSYS